MGIMVLWTLQNRIKLWLLCGRWPMTIMPIGKPVALGKIFLLYMKVMHQSSPEMCRILQIPSLPGALSFLWLSVIARHPSQLWETMCSHDTRVLIEPHIIIPPLCLTAHRFNKLVQRPPPARSQLLPGVAATWNSSAVSTRLGLKSKW